MLTFMKKRKSSIVVLLIYFIFAVCVNAPLFMGATIMKWDIMDSHYPNSMFLANSLSEGILPLWNPLFNYGSPHYASLGMPVYYPTTMLFALFGYRLWMVAAEYVLHVVIACFGMNLYISYIMGKEADRKTKQWIALFCGVIYGFSTLFLSNAQHIMIIISAAWIPYIFLNVSKLFESGDKKYLLYAAAFTGLSVQGGYPELWIGMLIVLIPYFVKCAVGSSFLYRVVNAVKYYVLYGVATFCASAVIVLPTAVLMPYLGRLNGTQAVSVSSYDWPLFLSALIPGWSNIYTGRTIDISMCSMYVGLFVIMMIPGVIVAKNIKGKWFSIGMILFAIAMMMGNNFFIHPIFQRFFPGFSTFRFPSVYRCFVCFFMLELTAVACLKVFDKEKKELRVVIVSAFCMVLFFAIMCVAGTQLVHAEIITDLGTLRRNCIVCMGIGILFLCIVVLFYMGKLDRTKSMACLALLIFAEVAIVYHKEFPITVGYPFSMGDLFDSNSDAQKYVDALEEENENREYHVDYTAAIRGNGSDSFAGSSKQIVYENELSEMGYTNVKLSFIEDYRKTANRYIIQGNPVFYFSNDVVTGETISLSDWVNQWGTDCKQIYVENVTHKMEEQNGVRKELPYEDKDIIERKVLPFDGNYIDFDFAKLSDSRHNRKWKLYVSDSFILGKSIDISFVDADGNHNVMNMEVENLYKDANGFFVYGCFPTHNAYSQIDVSGIEAELTRFEYLELCNEIVEESIDVVEFGPNRIMLDTDYSDNAYLVTLQTDYPGWHAYVDGEEQPIEQVNGAFRGLYLTKGPHHVEFVFRPVDFYIGIGISVLFYLWVLIALFKDIWKSCNYA